MALSGSFDTSKYNSKKWLRFSWTATQNIANNTSTISWSVAGVGTESGYHMTAPILVKINGEQVYYSETRIELRDGTAVASGTKTIIHASDGTASFSASVDAAIFTSAYNVSGSDTFALDAIPRKATITSYSTSFNDTHAAYGWIMFSNPLGSAVTMNACISLDGTTNATAWKSVSGTTGDVKWDLTTDNTLKNAMYALVTSGNSKQVYLLLRSTIGGSYYYDKYQVTFSITSPNPTMTVNYLHDTNATTTALTGDTTKFIKGYSNAYWKTTCAAVKGASLSSQYAVNNGNTLNGSGSGGIKEGTVTGVINGRFDFYVKDSRGNITTTPLTRTVIDYTPLTVAQSVGMPDTNGNFTLEITGDYWNGSFGSVSNTLTLQYTVYESGTSSSSWTWVNVGAAITKNNGKYSTSFTVNIPNFSESKTYSVRSAAIDQIYKVGGYGTKITSAYSIRLTPVFSWSDSDFQFNVPITKKLQIQSNSGAEDIMLRVKRTDTNRQVELGVGNGGYNMGVYNTDANSWMLYADSGNKTHIGGVDCSKATNGYVELPSGLILQWGSFSITPDTAGAVKQSSITFGTAFPTAALRVVLTPSTSRPDLVFFSYIESSLTRTGFTAYLYRDATIGAVATGCTFFAIGY